MIKEKIKEAYEKAENKIGFLNEVRDAIKEISPFKEPIENVRWVDIEKVKPNDYNPNKVAKKEMELLYKSIEHDGYTQPIVTFYDEDKDEYIIVDGFHRYYVAKEKEDIREKMQGKLPVTIINKGVNDRMASTIRHNRARGRHAIEGMSELVYDMFKKGWKDERICNELGMEAEELLRLKHITGFAKLFDGAKYNKAWESGNQIKIRKNYEKG